MTTPSLFYEPQSSEDNHQGEESNDNPPSDNTPSSDRVIYASPLALSISHDNNDYDHFELDETNSDPQNGDQEEDNENEEEPEEMEEYLKMSPFLSSLSHDTPLSKLISSVLLQQSPSFDPASPLMDLAFTSTSSHSKFTSLTGNNSSLSLFRALESKLIDLQTSLLDENGNKKMDSPEFMKKFSPSQLLLYLDLDRDLEVLENLLNAEDLLDRAPLTLLSR
jgi:hypothetical protein